MQTFQFFESPHAEYRPLTSIIDVWSAIVADKWLGQLAPLLGMSQAEVLQYLGFASVLDVFEADAACRGPYWYHATSAHAAQTVLRDGLRSMMGERGAYRRGLGDIDNGRLEAAVYVGSPLTALSYGSHLVEVELHCDILPYSMPELESLRATCRAVSVGMSPSECADLRARAISLAGMKALHYLGAVNGREIVIYDPSVIRVRRCIETSAYWRTHYPQNPYHRACAPATGPAQ